MALRATPSCTAICQCAACTCLEQRMPCRTLVAASSSTRPGSRATFDWPTLTRLSSRTNWRSSTLSSAPSTTRLSATSSSLPRRRRRHPSTSPTSRAPRSPSSTTKPTWPTGRTKPSTCRHAMCL